MDPGLEEAILRTPPAEDIEAVALLQPGRPLPDALRVVTRFGLIVTCRIPAGAVRAVRAHAAVVSLKAARVVEPSVVSPVGFGPAPQIDAESRARISRGIGRHGPVVLGVIDWGLDCALQALRRPDGGTRLLALWDQRARAIPDAGNPYGYGRIFDRARIDRALATANPYADLDYHPAASDPTGLGAHGTMVTSIAAGGTIAPAGAQGIAPEAELAFVHLATGLLPDTSDLGDSVRLLEGIDFIRRIAGGLPWVINCSLGRTGGDHSGRSLVEMAMDHVVHEAPGRAIVQSAGNYFDKHTHAQGLIRTGGAQVLEWQIAAADPTTNELEVWYSGRDAFGLELIPPGSRESFRAELGERIALELDGRSVGRAYHREREPITGDHHIDIFLEPGAPAGAWQVKLVGRDVVDGRFHAWIERDAAVPSAQSRFPPDESSPRSTLGTIATTYRTYVVGAATADGREIAPFSSSGPTRDGRIKPDLLAPGVSVVGARSTPFGAPPGSGGLTTQSGTSMAAPHVTGTIALLFGAAPRKLSAPETRALVLGSTERLPGLDPDRAGSGLLDTPAALDALRALLGRREPQMSQDPMLDAIEAAIPDFSYARNAFQAALDMARAQLPPEFQFVAGPGAAPVGGVRPEDLFVRTNPGEPVAPLVGRITSEATWSSGEPAWDAEYAGPGYYARVAPVYGPGVVVAPRYRRVLDYRGRVPPHHVVLRPRVVVGPRPTVVRPLPIYRPAPAWPAAPPPRPTTPMPPYVEPEPDEPTVGAEPFTDDPEPGLDEPIEGEAIAWPRPAAEELDEEPSEVGPGGCYEIFKAAPGTPPIIYFELDLNYGASSSSPPPATPDYSLEHDKITTHRKGAHGFRLEGDGNRIELATKEFELTAAGRTDMRATIVKVLDAMRELRRACEGATAHAGLGYPGGVGAPRHFKPAFAEAGVASIFPLGMRKRSASHPYYRATCAVAAVPQVTFEIPLAKVDTLVDIIRNSERHREAGKALSAPPGWRQGVRSQAIYDAQRAVNASRDEHIRRGTPVSGGRIVSPTTFTPTLQGLLILMVSYLRTGELAYTTDDYEGFAKSYLPINVKNPFRLLFSDLTADEKAVFSELYDSPRAELFALAKPGAIAADGGKQLFPARVASHQADFFSRVPTWNDLVEKTVNNTPLMRDVDSSRGRKKGGHEPGCELLFAPLSKIMPYARGSRCAALELRRLGFNWVFAGGLNTDGRDRPGWAEMTDMLFDLAVDLNRP